MSITALLRHGLVAAMIGLLLSCGGGGGSGNGGGTGVAAVGGTAMPAAGGGNAGGPGGPGGPGGGSAAPGGIGGIGADDGSSATASAGGDDASGVGSGGTGVSTADATGIGAVDGAGSIIVNGLRYDTKNAVGQVEDAPNGLQLGMSAKVIGRVSPDFTRGIARQVESAADLRGPVQWVSAAQGTFAILGVTVTTDEATVWADAPGLAAIAAGRTLQVWGLPDANGVLRATRVEQRDAAQPIVTGAVQNLDAASRSFMLGGLVVDFSGTVPTGGLDGQPLANGTIVRVRGNIVDGARLIATRVQWWYPLPRAQATIAQIAGVVTDFAGLGSLKVLGVPVDASGAAITGGPAGSIGNGVKIEIGGTVLADGVLHASKLKIRKVPGTGGPASFELIGNVGAFESPARFRVKGQPIDASDPNVVFTNGGPERLGNGVRVHVRGARVVEGVLIAESVSFE